MWAHPQPWTHFARERDKRKMCAAHRTVFRMRNRMRYAYSSAFVTFSTNQVNHSCFGRNICDMGLKANEIMRTAFVLNALVFPWSSKNYCWSVWYWSLQKHSFPLSCPLSGRIMQWYELRFSKHAAQCMPCLITCTTGTLWCLPVCCMLAHASLDVPSYLCRRVHLYQIRIIAYIEQWLEIHWQRYVEVVGLYLLPHP